MTTRPADLGANQAAAIRTAAAELGAIVDIAATTASREILFDLAAALVDLYEPVAALIDQHLDGIDDEAHQAECRDAVVALTTAASGLHQAANNE